MNLNAQEVMLNRIKLQAGCFNMEMHIVQVIHTMNIQLMGLDQSELCNCAMKH